MSRYFQRLLGPLALVIVVLGVYSAAFAQEQARPRNPRAAERAESPPPPPPPPPPPSTPPPPPPPPPQRHAVPRESSGREAGQRAEPQRAEPQPQTATANDEGGQTRSRRVPPSAQGRRGPDSGTATRGGEGVAVPRESRPREDRRATGRAVPRGSVDQPPRFRPSYRLPYWYYYPYGSAFGLGYYYYDPFQWGYGYSPYGYGYPYGGYGYGGYGYGGYGYPYGGYGGGGGGGQSYGIDYGSVRLKVKPRDAQVFADGYYVGRVDQFDGVFQSLKLNDGNHHIEIRADGYETLSFDLQITFDQKITYEGELKALTR